MTVFTFDTAGRACKNKREFMHKITNRLRTGGKCDLAGGKIVCTERQKAQLAVYDAKAVNRYDNGHFTRSKPRENHCILTHRSDFLSHSALQIPMH